MTRSRYAAVAVAVAVATGVAGPAAAATLPAVSGISFALPRGATLGSSPNGPVPVQLSWHQTNAGAVKACSYSVRRTSPAVMGTPATTAIVYTGSKPNTVDRTARQNTNYSYAVRALTCSKHAGPYAKDPRVVRTVMFDVFSVTATDFGGFWLTSHNPKFIEGEALRVAPGLANAQLAEVRIGLRPRTPDNLPVLCNAPTAAGVVIAAGHGATGLQLGPFSGKIAAELALGQPASVDISALHVDRFG